MRVFLDVGAHHGETARVVLAPEFRFGRVCCFDPDWHSWGYLEQLAQEDERVASYPFGLWNQTTTAPLYHAGRVGCSVFADKFDTPTPAHRISEGMFVKASDWCASNWAGTTSAILKLNCEGCECDILDDLMDEGWLRHLDVIYVDFDVRKIPSQAHRQNEVLKRLLRQHPLPLILGPEDLPEGAGVVERTQHWLRLAGVGA